ncbi:hypothetical protein, partial [Brevibacterium senegalense]|uniref:hypothetical protein n=1 Tax=Brevibacterium senegalense TaxID=1033736 RepID=UPI001C54E373
TNRSHQAQTHPALTVRPDKFYVYIYRHPLPAGPLRATLLQSDEMKLYPHPALRRKSRLRDLRHTLRPAETAQRIITVCGTCCRLPFQWYRDNCGSYPTGHPVLFGVPVEQQV